MIELGRLLALTEDGFTIGGWGEESTRVCQAAGFAVAPDAWERVEHLLVKYGASAARIGKTVGDHILAVRKGDEEILRLGGAEMGRAWIEPVGRAMR